MNKQDVKTNLKYCKENGNKLQAVGFIKMLTQWGLKESKDFIDEHLHKSIEEVMETLYADSVLVRRIKNATAFECRQFLCPTLITKYKL